ncbi:hypothetical protein CON65_22955 [Bacillus pseudomycoides]|uniref:Uncharacterized protein n=1 Tax=Bacillus pseudomycoides TaxID=64104 RepID=A0AA91ZR83_9BACI|nr:hypothetical protein COO03_12490 [Bacillus sp. AFS098217]PED80365.1 hypothetical protein CON65_22955 [Bacillus pseudomycoides]
MHFYEYKVLIIQYVDIDDLTRDEYECGSTNYNINGQIDGEIMLATIYTSKPLFLGGREHLAMHRSG